VDKKNTMKQWPVTQTTLQTWRKMEAKWVKTQVISAIWSHSQKDNKFEKFMKYGERPCLNKKRNKQK
jgi:hypothetical protein